MTEQEQIAFVKENCGDLFLSAGDLVKLVGYSRDEEDYYWTVVDMKGKKTDVSLAISLMPLSKLDKENLDYLQHLFDINTPKDEAPTHSGFIKITENTKLSTGDEVCFSEDISFGQDHQFFKGSLGGVIFTFHKQFDDKVSLKAPGYGEQDDYGNGMIYVGLKQLYAAGWSRPKKVDN